MNRQRLLELIDACRPGSDDHLHGELAELGEELARDPAARELFEQVQSLDGRLVELFHAREVAPPADLQSRIVAALAAQATSAESPAAPTPLAGVVEAVTEAATETAAPAINSAAPLEPVLRPRSKQPSRRRFIAVVAGSLAAIAAIFALSVWLRPGPASSLTAQQIADRATTWEESLAADGWQTNVAWRMQDTPLPPELRGQPFQWHAWQDPWRGQGVAYDFSPSTAPGSVLLYATSAEKVIGAPVGPPTKAQFSSGNLTVAVWQRNATLYVLVIHGPRDRYRQLVEPSTFAQLAPESTLFGCIDWLAR